MKQLICLSELFFEKKGSKYGKIDENKCTSCGGCIDLCPAIAISMIDDVAIVENELCKECGICVKVCPMKAPREIEQ